MSAPGRLAGDDRRPAHDGGLALRHALVPRRWAWIAAVVVLTGCASVRPPGPPNAADPWERFNRQMFAFNEAVDEAVLAPVARVYRDVVPSLVRTGVSNFFGNVGDIWSTANHLLQGKVESGVHMGMRVLTNTLMGIGGLLDPATEFGLKRQSEDLGQTLGVWGFGPGPYLVLPLLGPSSLRDTVGMPFDRYATSSSVWWGGDAAAQSALQLVNVRAELLATTRLIGDVSLDKYAFVRDGYLARRLDQVYDGSPPLPKFEDEGADPEPPKPGK